MAVLLICIAGACGGEPEPERPPELSVLARWTFGDINLVHEPEWVGQRAIHFIETERPQSDYRLRSLLSPLTVHAEADIPVEVAESALAALEISAASLSRMGWPAALPDGGLGGTDGFDLYLTTHGTWSADASPDQRTLAGPLDATTGFGIVDVGLCGSHGLDASITSALAQTITLNLDPAEGKHWRRATGAFLAWHVNGQFGAADAVEAQQREPWRSWIEEGVNDGEGGALLLALLSRRYDGGNGSFVRELWHSLGRTV